MVDIWVGLNILFDAINDIFDWTFSMSLSGEDC